MTIDRETALRASQKFRLMRNGNIVALVSLAVILANAILALMIVWNNPLAFFVTGGMELLAFFMLLSGIAALVGGIMYVVGLYGLRDVRSEYKDAFLCEIGLIVLTIIGSLVGSGSVLGQILSTITTLGTLVVLWLVILGTRHLLENLERDEILRRGKILWWLSVASTALACVYALIPVPAAIGTGAIILLSIGVVISAFSIVAAVYYVSYLGRVANALEAQTLEQAVKALEEEL